MKDYTVLGKVMKNRSNVPSGIMFKTPTDLKITLRISTDKTQEYDQKFSKVDLITNNLQLNSRNLIPLGVSK